MVRLPRPHIPKHHICRAVQLGGNRGTQDFSRCQTCRTRQNSREGHNLRIRGRIADLTGGLGADSCAFREAGFKVLYNEMDEALCNAARHNFRALGHGDIIISGKEVKPGDISGILVDFAPDIIYLDPARRDGAGKKVFLMEDCRPDILALKDELLGCAQYVMVKLSPMADIDMVLSRLGAGCREIHIVASKGECRELLAVLDRNWKGEPEFIAWESTCNPFVFTAQEKRLAAMRLTAGPDRLSGFLFEPGKALLAQGRGIQSPGRALRTCQAGKVDTPVSSPRQ